ncbi:MAG: hypothetical protein C4339_02790 [Nitrososphaerota archaeon]
MAARRGLQDKVGLDRALEAPDYGAPGQMADAHLPGCPGLPPGSRLSRREMEAILGRGVGRREYVALRALGAEGPNESISALCALLTSHCALLERELLEYRAWALYRRANERGLRLLPYQATVLAFYLQGLEAGLSKLEVLEVLAKAQFHPVARRLGLLNLRLPALRLLIRSKSKSGIRLYVDGEPREAQLMVSGTRGIVIARWAPLLRDCLVKGRLMSATKLLSATGSEGALLLATEQEDAEAAWAPRITVTLRPSEFSYVLRLLAYCGKELSISLGHQQLLASARRRLSPQNLAASRLLLEKAGLLRELERRASSYLSPALPIASEKQVAAALIAADMELFRSLPMAQRLELYTLAVELGLTRGSRGYTGLKGLLVPQELEERTGARWSELYRLALSLEEN